MNLSKEEINEIAENAAKYLLENNEILFLETLKPILDDKCAFSKLDMLGGTLGYKLKYSPDVLIKGFDILVNYNKMGGYVVLGQGLIQLLPENLDIVMKKSREYIILGDKWYVCDIIGERSIGQSLVDHFDITIPWIEKFLEDENNWIKRTAGVSVHFFTKRTKKDKERTAILLNKLAPHIEEKQIDVVKGIGWGLKTIGKYHPDLLVPFLKKQIKLKKKISKIIIRKALTYLPKEKRLEIESLV
jgi:3-methyladenine DNA glycosylase AlkD